MAAPGEDNRLENEPDVLEDFGGIVIDDHDINSDSGTESGSDAETIVKNGLSLQMGYDPVTMRSFVQVIISCQRFSRIVSVSR